MVEKIENLLGVDSMEFQPLSIFRQIFDSLGIALLFLLGNIMILFLNVVPLLGTIFSMICGILFQSFCLSMEFFDFSLSLRGYHLKRKIDYLREHPGMVLGIGNVSWLFMMIPILNSCLFSLSILAATFRVRRKKIESIQDQLFKGENIELLTKGYEILEKYQIKDIPTDSMIKESDYYVVYTSKLRETGQLIKWISTGEVIDKSS